MLSFPSPPRLNMPAFNISSTPFPDRGLDSPSPYPPSSPSSDSEDDERPDHLSVGVRASIAAIPESRLRSIIVKLADSNPGFQRAIMKELTYAQPFVDSSPTTPTNAKQRKARRSKPRRNYKGLSVSTRDVPVRGHKRNLDVAELEVPCQNEFVYHPGHLDEEVYEFLSRTPEEVAFKVVRTITMWSCCDEDEWSPGCVVAPYGVNPVDHKRDHQGIAEFTHSDVFPDSDLEQSYERTVRDSFARSSHSA